MPLLLHMRMITPAMARALTPTEFVEREKAVPRHRRADLRLVMVRSTLSRLAHTLRHPRLRHVGH